MKMLTVSSSGLLLVETLLKSWAVHFDLNFEPQSISVMFLQVQIVLLQR